MTLKQRIFTCGLLSLSAFICVGQDRQQASIAGVDLPKPVKGVPFTASVVTEAVQTLADGNRIVRKGTANLARDSEGRTRREQHFVAGEQQRDQYETSVVFIQDPVAEVIYIVEPGSRTARRLSISQTTNSIPPPQPSSAPYPSFNRDSLKGVIVRTESLGTKLIEGLSAEGSRLITTVPQGQLGNERALEVMSEAWYSTELQMIVLNRTLDPRVGESTYRITDVQRVEPPHSLFEVPSDYTISSETRVSARGPDQQQEKLK